MAGRTTFKRREAMAEISIVLPALNEAAGIAFAVERAWSLGACEVVVADGGSSDATADLARGAGATVLTTPRGRGIQQNRGAEPTRGDVLLFLHADCWLDPDARRQIEQALGEPRILC